MSSSNLPIGSSLCFPKGHADLNEDGDHSDAMGALSCLSVVGVQILVIMDQLDLKERHKALLYSLNYGLEMCKKKKSQLGLILFGLWLCTSPCCSDIFLEN